MTQMINMDNDEKEYFDIENMAEEVDFKSEIEYNFGWMSYSEYGYYHTPFDDLGDNVTAWLWLLDKMKEWYEFIPEITHEDKEKFISLFSERLTPMLKDDSGLDDVNVLFTTTSAILVEIFNARVPKDQKFYVL